MHKVFDKILDTNTENIMEQITTSGSFPWFFCPATNHENNIEELKYLDNMIDSPMFCHIVVQDGEDNSPFCNIVKDICSTITYNIGLDNYSLKKCKINFQYPNLKDKNHYNCPHTDFSTDESFLTVLYYVNESTGSTFIFDKEYNILDIIEPKKGRFVVMDGDTIHAGSNPMSNYRIVINFNIFFEEKNNELV